MNHESFFNKNNDFLSSYFHKCQVEEAISQSLPFAIWPQSLPNYPEDLFVCSYEFVPSALFDSQKLFIIYFIISFYMHLTFYYLII